MVSDILKTSKALGDETRFAIYRHLADGGKSLSIRDLAGHFHLHPNAIRQHLAKLEEVHLVVFESTKKGGAGRPQRIYRKNPESPDLPLLPRDYKLLAQILLEYLVSRTSSEEIRAFGEEWGKRFRKGKGVPAEETISFQEATERLFQQFSLWGFKPEIVSSSPTEGRVKLHNCIFEEIASLYPDLICPLLHGVIEGMAFSSCEKRSSSLENGIAHGGPFCTAKISIKSSIKSSIKFP